MRDALVASRTQLINSVRGGLRTQLRRITSGIPETFPSRVRKHFTSKSATVLPRFVERQLEAINSLNTQIHEADHELAELAKSDSVCVRLMTVPGVGPVTAVRYLATIDEVERFCNAHRVASYLRPAPCEKPDSERKRRTRITKAGPAALTAKLQQTD